jgi:hypothetical protein
MPMSATVGADGGLYALLLSLVSGEARVVPSQ